MVVRNGNIELFFVPVRSSESIREQIWRTKFNGWYGMCYSYFVNLEKKKLKDFFSLDQI